MNVIFRYIKEFYTKEFNWLYFLTILVIMGCVIYFNYWHGLEKKYVYKTNDKIGNFYRSYLLYLIPFATAFLLQFIFYKNCTHQYNIWFWIILLLAPAFFAFRVNFTFHQKWVGAYFNGTDKVFYVYCFNWIIRVIVLLLPVLVIWLIKDKAIQPFYGAKPLTEIMPYLLMLLIMVPLISLASTQSDFLNVYPKAKLLDKIPMHNWTDKWRYLVFEMCYGVDFISIEFFFRGFLILALMNICGLHCIIPVACFYCTIHLGKPMGEAISSFWGGTLLGIIAYNTGSVWGGLIIHLGIAWMMEIGGWLGLILSKIRN